MAFLSTDPPESDWFGGNKIVAFFKPLFIGSFVVTLLAAVAFFRKERYAVNSLAAAVPCMCFVLLVMVMKKKAEHKHVQRVAEREQENHHFQRLLSNPDIVATEEWPPDGSPRGVALANFLSVDKGRKVQEEHLLALAKNNPKWLEKIYYHRRCPESLLREGFAIHKSEKGQEFTGSLRSIIAHRNSPIEFAEEVSGWTLDEHARSDVERTLTFKRKAEKEPEKTGHSESGAKAK